MSYAAKFKKPERIRIEDAHEKIKEMLFETFPGLKATPNSDVRNAALHIINDFYLKACLCNYDMHNELKMGLLDPSDDGYKKTLTELSDCAKKAGRYSQQRTEQAAELLSSIDDYAREVFEHNNEVATGISAKPGWHTGFNR